MNEYSPAIVVLLLALVGAGGGSGRILSALGLILFAMAIWVHYRACRRRGRS